MSKQDESVVFYVNDLTSLDVDLVNDRVIKNSI